jgi:DNA gyrase inhibitor GyrI
MTPLLLGIARDAPGITPAAKIRFDGCVQVPAAFEADGEIGCQRTPGGDHAITEYVGSWDMGPAYGSILERLGNMPKLDVIGLPAIEIYRTTQVGARDGLARVAIAIPVATRGRMVSARRCTRCDKCRTHASPRLRPLIPASCSPRRRRSGVDPLECRFTTLEARVVRLDRYLEPIGELPLN